MDVFLPHPMYRILRKILTAVQAVKLPAGCQGMGWWWTATSGRAAPCLINHRAISRGHGDASSKIGLTAWKRSSMFQKHPKRGCCSFYVVFRLLMSWRSAVSFTPWEIPPVLAEGKISCFWREFITYWITNLVRSLRSTSIKIVYLTF